LSQESQRVQIPDLRLIERRLEGEVELLKRLDRRQSGEFEPHRDAALALHRDAALRCTASSAPSS